MFSVKNSGNSYKVKCMLNKDPYSTISFYVDTGSDITVVNGDALGYLVDNNQIINDTPKENIKIIGGIVLDKENNSQYTAIVYKYHVSSFTLHEDVVLYGVDIWVVFDKKFTNNLLGVDILHKLLYLNNPMSDSLVFFNTFVDNGNKEFVDYLVGDADKDSGLISNNSNDKDGVSGYLSSRFLELFGNDAVS